MQITSVEYRRLRSFGNFENESIGAVASVESGQHPEGVLEELRKWVEQELEIRMGAYEVRDQINESRAELRTIKADLALAVKRWEKAKAFLEKHGVEIPTHDDDLPF